MLVVVVGLLMMVGVETMLYWIPPTTTTTIGIINHNHLLRFSRYRSAAAVSVVLSPHHQIGHRLGVVTRIDVDAPGGGGVMLLTAVVRHRLAGEGVAQLGMQPRCCGG